MKKYKNLLSLSLLFLFSIGLIFLSSCKKNEVEPANGDDFKLGLFDLQTITVPDAMAQSSDPHAQQANAQILLLGSFKIYQAFFLFPVGAEKSNTPITGRRAGNYSVYKWSDGNGGEIAYQYRQDGDKIFFEVFFKENGSNYVKFIDGTQTIGRSAGIMYIYEKGFNSTTLVAVEYTWDYNNDVSTSSMKTTESDVLLEVVSQADKSGELLLKENGVVRASWSWNAAGVGSWIDYNEDGSVSDQGSWG